MATGNLHINSRMSVVPLIAVVVVVVVCTALGFWQLDRADQKRTILAQRLAQAEADIRSLPGDAELVTLDPSTIVHAPVQISGEWLSNFEILLDNQVHSSRAGCHVLTPMQVSGSKTVVLINRGWVAWGPDRASLPQTRASSGTQSIRGRIWLPVEGGFSLGAEAENETSEWPRLWQNLDLSRYAKRLGAEYELLPFIVRMDAVDNAVDTAGTSQGESTPERIGQYDGYRRDWFEPTDLWIHRHVGYAVQWFGLAAIAIFLYWIRRRKNRQTAGIE